MIEVNLNGSTDLLILNNRVFKRLAELNILDALKTNDDAGLLAKVDDPDFIEKVGYMCYLEGCKSDMKQPISEAEFSKYLKRADALKISNLILSELIEVGEYVTAKKKQIAP